MSSRPWHRPQPVEVSPSKPPYFENLAIAFGLAVLIVSVKLWRLVFGHPVGKPDRS